VVAVGGGAAGFESLLAVMARLRALRPDGLVEGVLISRSATLLEGLSAPARRAGLAALSAAGVAVTYGRALSLQDTEPGDLVLWATGAQAHPWLRDASARGCLSVDERGFVRIDACLRALSHPDIFAVGDCAHWSASEAGLPKAGVFAVRMGPVLNANLRASLLGRALQTYVPQQQHLVLLATADGRAIASRGRLGAQGRWIWHWKDRIDRAFIRRFGGA
jgi:NADH dehydrogenase FAD-containing subunit